MHTFANIGGKLPFISSPSLQNDVPITDIVEAAGVPHSTIYRVLPPSPLFIIPIKQGMQPTARETGCTDSAIGRGLVTRRAATIDPVFTTIPDPSNWQRRASW